MNTAISGKITMEQHIDRAILRQYAKRIDELLDLYNEKKMTKAQLEKEFITLSTILAKDNS